ncbi:hypothetical protein RI662_10755 [Brevibacillus agri]|uniref:hypothetical protein n=1 Tax=Brevibacillus agri TaxID=51101 RepID=UPI0028707361|nr:hypothetical protein [Brevibacillus agri]MDR9504770.1 hypothetical protein [Brevibacillus agri]
MWMGIGLLGLVTTIISAIMLIFSAIKRDSRAAKKRGLVFVVSLIVFVTGVSLGSGDSVESTVQKNEQSDTSATEEKSREKPLETIGVGAYVFKKNFNTAAKAIGFQIADEQFKPTSETEYLESYKLKLDDNYHLNFDVDKKSKEITGLVLSGNVEYKVENVGTLIRLIDATIVGVDQTITEDARKQLIKQLGFGTDNAQDIQSLDKKISTNGLMYWFTSTKDGEIGFGIGKKQ